jgi:hypothetical protein
LLADGISSQRPIDRQAALRRMAKAGAHVTSAESVLFDLLGGGKAPEFKPLLKIIKMKREVILENV